MRDLADFREELRTPGEGFVASRITPLLQAPGVLALTNARLYFQVGYI